MDEDDLEATALITLTDDLHDAADSDTNVVGGCLSFGLIVILLLIWWFVI